MSVTFRKLPISTNSLLTSAFVFLKPATPTCSWTCNRPLCKICLIYHPTNYFTSSYIKHSYPIITHGDSKSSYLIYQLQYIECDEFYIGEACSSLSDCINGHSFHHHSLKLTSAHFHPHTILADSISGLLVYPCHTQISWHHPWSYLLPIKNDMPTYPPIQTYSWSKNPLTPLSPSFHPTPSSMYLSVSVWSNLLLTKSSVSESSICFLSWLYFLVTLICWPSSLSLPL